MHSQNDNADGALDGVNQPRGQDPPSPGASESRTRFSPPLHEDVSSLILVRFRRDCRFDLVEIGIGLDGVPHNQLPNIDLGSGLDTLGQANPLGRL